MFLRALPASLLLAGPALGEPTPPASDTPPALAAPVVPVSSTIQIVYTGGAGGIGAGRPPAELLNQLEEALVDTGLAIDTVAVAHGVVAQGPHLLRADHTMAGLVSFLDGSEVSCTDAPSRPAARGLTGRLEVSTTERPPWLDALGSELSLRTRSCTNGSGVTATLTSASGGPEPVWELESWETRPSVLGQLVGSGQRTDFLAVGEPLQDTSRTVAAALKLLAESDAPTVYVDAGEFLDGASSVVDHAPSLHRPTGLAALARLSPVALVPGRNELVAGASSFLAEQAPYELPYIATNWSTEAHDLTLPAYRLVELPLSTGDTARIAFIGILDPEWMVDLPQLRHEGVEITDPIGATQAVVRRIEQLQPPPSAIIALTTASGPVQERVRRELRGVDLLLGDPSLATLRTTARSVELRPLTSAQKGAAVTLPMDGLAITELAFAPDGQLEQVDMRPVLIDGTNETDPQTAAAISRVRAETYPQLEASLLGPPSDSLLEPWSQAEWEALICEAVRTGSDADVALLDHLPSAPELPGPLTELAVLNHLAVLDTLELHRIPGTQLQRLADRADGAVPIACGISPGSRVTRVGARWLETDRTYTVVTTSPAAESTPVGEILESLRSTRVLDQPGVHPVPSPQDPTRAATLRSVAIERLREVRDQTGQGGQPVGPDGLPKAMLVDGPTALEPLWLLRIRRIGLQSQSFKGVDDPAFGTVPETLATSPSSFTLGSEGDIALEYSGPSLLSDLRTQTSFTRLSVGEEDPEEIADDLLLSTSHSLPGAAFAIAPPLQMMPFGEVAYDSEFTAIEEEDGGTGIAQSDLSLTVGLAALRAGPLRSLRVGGFVNRDMARLDEKPPEFGGRLDWETWQAFGPSVQWTTSAALLWFGDTPDDDASDLRLRAIGESRLFLPLAGALQLGVYGQVFALQGRTEVNDRIAASTTVGVTLDVVGAFAL